MTCRGALVRSMLWLLAGLCWPGLLARVFQRKGASMQYLSVTKRILFSAAVCVLLAIAPAKATIYDEAISGDLSNNKAAPTPLTLTAGSNSVIGTANGFGNDDPQ